MKIDLKDGKISYNSFDVDLDKPLEEQLWQLREDLLQIEYAHCFIDVGFFPEGDPSGFFVIRVIKDFDWEHPLLEKEATREQLVDTLQQCINFATQVKQD